MYSCATVGFAFEKAKAICERGKGGGAGLQNESCPGAQASYQIG